MAVWSELHKNPNCFSHLGYLWVPCCGAPSDIKFLIGGNGQTCAKPRLKILKIRVLTFIDLLMTHANNPPCDRPIALYPLWKLGSFCNIVQTCLICRTKNWRIIKLANYSTQSNLIKRMNRQTFNQISSGIIVETNRSDINVIAQLRSQEVCV